MKTWYLFLVEIKHKASEKEILQAMCVFEKSYDSAKQKLNEALVRFSNSFWEYKIPLISKPLVKYAETEVTSINVLGEINGSYASCINISTNSYQRFKQTVSLDYYDNLKRFKPKYEDSCDFTNFL